MTADELQQRGDDRHGLLYRRPFPEETASLFDQVALSEESVEFLMLPAYAHID